jgi:hypothetical protein
LAKIYFYIVGVAPTYQELAILIKFELAMWNNLRPDYPRLRLVFQVEKINK